MKDLYHLSHFFEFLCGLYFGGTAILGFIESSLIKRFYKPLEQQTNEFNQVRILSKQYLKVTVNKSLRELKYRDFYILFAYVCFYIADLIFYRVFKLIVTVIIKLDLTRKDVLLKKFFPSFLFNGIFCLLIVLLSGFQEGNSNARCSDAINLFLINLGLGILVYQLMALIIIPRLVNFINYLHVMLITLVLIILFVTLSFTLADGGYVFKLNFLLQPIYKGWVQLGFVFIGLFPLIAIIFFMCLILVTWELTCIFYKWANNIFISQIEGVVSNDVQNIR